MSALVVGADARMGEVGDRLIECGFDEIGFRNGKRFFDTYERKPDVVVLMKESMKELEARGVLGKIAALGAPVFIW